MTTRTRTPASHTGTAEVDLDEETVLLVDDPATWPKGERAGSIRTLVAMPAYNEEAYIAKTVLGARPARGCGPGRRRRLDGRDRPDRGGAWGDRCPA
jgi:hypothetical protein